MRHRVSAACSMPSTVSPVMAAHSARSTPSMRALKSSNPSVQLSTKAVVCHVFVQNHLHHAVEQGHIRARLVAQIQVGELGNLVLSGDRPPPPLAPFSRALKILVATRGWAVAVLDPMIKMVSESSSSAIAFVMAPLPNAAARPATVEECHNRAQ